MHHQRPVKRRLLSTLAIMSISALLCTSAAAERNDPADWSDIRSYTPSLGVGIGVTFDKTEASVFGEVFDKRSGGTVQYRSDQEESFVGGAVDVNFRLMLPEFEVASRPRLFVSFEYAARLQKNSLLAEWGSLPNLWKTDFLSTPYHTEVSTEPGYRLRAAVGAAFDIPNDFYPIRVSASIGYATSKTEVAFNDWYLDGGLNTNLVRFQGTNYEFITHDVSPGIALDVEIDRTGQFAWGFFTEFYSTIPLNNPTQSETRRVFETNPAVRDQGEANYYAEQGVSFQVYVGLRLSWVGGQ